MNMLKCKKCNRFYDPSYPQCPFCSGEGVEDDESVTQAYSAYGDLDQFNFGNYDNGAGSDINPTMKHDAYGGNTYGDPYAGDAYGSNMQKMATAGFEVAGSGIPTDDEDVKTVSFYGPNTIGGGESPVNPVVGWLVCLRGKNLGKDFHLRTGKNYVGRSETMDVALKGENTVSRDKHATVLFEPRQKIFLVQPGESRELAYLNNELILQPQVLKQGDVISVGDVDLLFIPLCSPGGFSWSQYMQV